MRAFVAKIFTRIGFEDSFPSLDCLCASQVAMFCTKFYYPVSVPFDAHCCHTGNWAYSYKSSCADRAKPSFVIFDIRAL